MVYILFINIISLHRHSGSAMDKIGSGIRRYYAKHIVSYGLLLLFFFSYIKIIATII